MVVLLALYARHVGRGVLGIIFGRVGSSLVRLLLRAFALGVVALLGRVQVSNCEHVFVAIDASFFEGRLY